MTSFMPATGGTGEDEDELDQAPVRYLLTRRRIVRAALRVVDEQGLAALNMRRLAADLGVTPRALYRHVADKHDLLRAVCEEALGEISPPAGADLPWQERVRQVQGALRRALDAHPHVVALLAQTPTAFPAALLRVAEAVAAALQAGGTGVTPELALRYAYALYNYVLGFATIAALTEPEGAGGSELHALAGQVAAMAATQAPTLAAAGPFLARFVADLHAADEQFDLGIDLLLQGMERR